MRSNFDSLTRELDELRGRLEALEPRVGELARRLEGLEAVSPDRREARLIANALQVVEHAVALGQLSKRED